MPKRSPGRPFSKNEAEQKRVNQRFYGKLENEKSRINPVFLERPHYGIQEPVNLISLNNK